MPCFPQRPRQSYLRSRRTWPIEFSAIVLAVFGVEPHSELSYWQEQQVRGGVKRNAFEPSGRPEERLSPSSMVIQLRNGQKRLGSNARNPQGGRNPANRHWNGWHSLRIPPASCRRAL